MSTAQSILKLAPGACQIIPGWDRNPLHFGFRFSILPNYILQMKRNVFCWGSIVLVWGWPECLEAQIICPGWSLDKSVFKCGGFLFPFERGMRRCAGCTEKRGKPLVFNFKACVHKRREHDKCAQSERKNIQMLTCQLEAVREPSSTLPTARIPVKFPLETLEAGME